MRNKKNNMEKYREKLEYPKIIARLVEYASFAPGRELLEALELYYRVFLLGESLPEE